MAQSILVECAGQILDNLSDVTNGPVQGTVGIASTSLSTIAVPKGLRGTLPDGRVVRVRKPFWIYPTIPTVDARCRLELLGATLGKNNFAPVTTGMVVTWETGHGLDIADTALVTADFAAGPFPLLTAIPWGTQVPNDEQALSTFITQGSLVATLHFTSYEWAPKGGMRKSNLKYTWALRVWASNLQGQRSRPEDYGRAIDAIGATLFDATVMSDIVSPESSKDVKTKINAWCHELKFHTLVWTPGRTFTPEVYPTPIPVDDLYATIILPDDGDQDPSFQVVVDAQV